MYCKTKDGGTMIAVNSGMPSSQVSSPDNMEIVIIFVYSSYPVTICAAYIQPNSDSQYYHNLYFFLSMIGSYKNFIILGDFNAPDIDWLTLHNTTHSSGMFCDFFFDCNLSQLIQVGLFLICCHNFKNNRSQFWQK